jgi:hypothetical protein
MMAAPADRTARALAPPLQYDPDEERALSVPRSRVRCASGELLWQLFR